MVGWNTYNIAPSPPLADGADLATLSRIPGHMELFYITPTGAIHDFWWYGTWNNFELCPPGSAAPGGLTFVSRMPTHMEGWWISPSGSVEGIFWYDDNKGWRRYPVAGPGSAAVGSRLTAVSRAKDHMEVWWVAPNGSVQAAYWYERFNKWQYYPLAGPGSATVRSGLTSVSREAKAIEVWWVAPDGGIWGAWTYDGAEPGWHPYPMQGAGPGSAVLGGGLRVQARKADVLNLWWISPQGSVEGCFTVAGKTPWARYQMAGPGSASLSSGITSLHRIPSTEEIFWVRPDGAVMDAFWYEGMANWQVFQGTPSNTAKTNSRLAAVSREPGTMETWYGALGGGVADRYWYDFRTKTFSASITSGGLAALGGWTSVTLKEQGSLRWNGDGHDSGADDYDYGVVGVLRPREGSGLAPITLIHTGHVEGHIFGNSGRDDPWDITNDKDYVGLIQAHYDDYANGTFAIGVQYTSGFLKTFESLINTAVKWTVGSLLDGVGLLIFIGAEAASLATTGSLVPGARILNGVLWMAGPANTLLAVAAGVIANAGSRSRMISVEDYNWANAEVYSGTLPPREKIWITDTKGKDNRAFTFPMSDGRITLNVGGKAGMYDNPRSYAGVLIHELAHAWQIHHTPMQLSLLADAMASQLRGGTSYDYPLPGQLYRDMNLESQAQIVQDWWSEPAARRLPAQMTGPAKSEQSPYFRYIRDNIRLGTY